MSEEKNPENTDKQPEKPVKKPTTTVKNLANKPKVKNLKRVAVEAPKVTEPVGIKSESECFELARKRGHRFEFNYLQGKKRGFTHDAAWQWAVDREPLR